LERLRSVEFYRDWGLELQPQLADEHLPYANIELTDSANNLLRYQTSAYIRSDGYKGFRQLLVQDQKIKGWQLRNIFNLTNINSQYNKGYFLRPTVDISRVLPKFGNYTVGASYALEHNEIRDKRTDSISRLSFAFNTISAYIKSDQAKDNHWGITYFTRADKLPTRKSLEQSDRSHNISFNTELLANNHHQVRLNVTYRQLQVINKSLSNLQLKIPY
jgi:hypothetical protein